LECHANFALYFCNFFSPPSAAFSGEQKFNDAWGIFYGNFWDKFMANIEPIP
jgi:hypothetical protein